MNKTKRLLLCFGILIIIVAKSRGAGNGCAWSGCQHFAFVTCLTEMTGVQGRIIRMKHKGCQIIGRKDYCCDEDCAYQDCGVTCEDLKMDDYSHEVSSLHCDNKFGVKPTKMKHFCCPRRSSRPDNGFSNSSGNTGGEGSGFRPGSNDGGFRGSVPTDPNNQDPANNTREEGSGFRTGNGGFRGSVPTDPNNQDPVSSTGEEGSGFRTGSSNGGFRGPVSSNEGSPDNTGAETESLGFRN